MMVLRMPAGQWGQAAGAAASVRRRCVHGSRAVLLAYVAFSGVFGAAEAAPLELNGSVSLNYMSSRSQSATYTTKYVTGTISGASYIWQPWLATWTANLSVNKMSSGSGGGGSSDTLSFTGDAVANLFPRSRFPASVQLDVTDSAVQMPTADSSGDSTARTRSRQIRIRENYTSYGGLNVNAWYNTAIWESTNRADVNTDGAGVWIGQRFTDQNLQLSITDYQSRSAGVTNSHNLTMTLTHDYAPGTEFNVNTLVSRVNTTSSAKVSDATTLNATSNFFWRPDYRPLSVSGGIRFNEVDRSSGSNQDLSVFAGANYQVTRGLRVNASVNGNIREGSSGTRTGSAAQSVGANYNSDTVYFGKVGYHWGGGVTATNQMARGGGVDTDSRLLTTSFTHDAQRAWSITDRSRISGSISQGLNATENFTTSTLTKGISHSARLAWNGNDDESTTSAWVSLTDSRMLANPTTGTRTLSGNLSRTQSVTRLSSFTGSLNTTRTDPFGGTATGSTTTNSGSAEYLHSRVFGVYRLRFRSVLDLSRASDFRGNANLISRWQNRLDYSIGMLVASASLNRQWTSTGLSTTTLLFQVTRRF